MTERCATLLGPALAAASVAIENAQTAGEGAFGTATAECPLLKKAGDVARSQLLKKIDNDILCTIMCCCSKQHSELAAIDRAAELKPTRKRQDCVRETLDAADEKLNYASRYKAEVYYNMTTEPPSPFMHREDGGLTTEKSRGGMWRIIREIPDYQKYDSRRPDIVIAKDPSKPPVQSNIERIVEMKFKGDGESGKNQYADYADIAGGADKVSVMREGIDCKCDDDRQRQPETVPVVAPAPQEEPSKARTALETAFWGTVTLVGVVATVALALSPFDGPAGETATGIGTVTAASNFARSWSQLFRILPAH